MTSGEEVLLVQRGVVHPSLRAQRAIARMVSRLCADRGIAGRRLTLRRAHDLRALDARVPMLTAICFHAPRGPRSDVQRLTGLVASGGALLVLHGGCASYKGVSEYAALIGARFAGHDPIGEHNLTREAAMEADYASALPAEVPLHDEAYRCEMGDDVEVWYRWEDGSPAVWRHGRVGCLSPGHRAEVWTDPAIARITAALGTAILGGGAGA